MRGKAVTGCEAIAGKAGGGAAEGGRAAQARRAQSLVAAQRVYVQTAALKAGIDGPEVPASARDVYRALHAVYHPAGAPHSPVVQLSNSKKQKPQQQTVGRAMPDASAAAAAAGDVVVSKTQRRRLRRKIQQYGGRSSAGAAAGAGQLAARKGAEAARVIVVGDTLLFRHLQPVLSLCRALPHSRRSCNRDGERMPAQYNNSTGLP